MKRVKRPELRLHGQKVRLKKKPVILAVSVLVLIVLLVQPWKKQRLPKRS